MFLFRVLLLQSRLCAHYFEPLIKMFGAWNPRRDTNLHKIFSALNLAIIFIKPFTCIIMPLLSFFNKILFVHLTFSFKHVHHYWHLLKTWCITMTDWTDDTASTHAFISDIPSQMHPSPIIMWQVILIFMLFVLSAQEIMVKFWLITRQARSQWGKTHPPLPHCPT